MAAQKTIAKWVAKRLLYFALAELAVKQAYNGLGFYLSFTRLAEANQINGGVLDAPTYLQKRIDETAIDLRSCS